MPTATAAVLDYKLDHDRAWQETSATNRGATSATAGAVSGRPYFLTEASEARATRITSSWYETRPERIQPRDFVEWRVETGCPLPASAPSHAPLQIEWSARCQGC